VPFLIIFAPAWGWVVFANGLLGINQGLCAQVVMEETLPRLQHTRQGQLANTQ